MHYCVGKFFGKPGVVDGQVAQQLLHVFALGMFVGRARVMYDGQIACVADNVTFLQVDHGADQGYARARHERLWLESVEPSFVK